jgi:hypothetical protein
MNDQKLLDAISEIVRDNDVHMLKSYSPQEQKSETMCGSVHVRGDDNGKRVTGDWERTTCALCLRAIIRESINPTDPPAP